MSLVALGSSTMAVAVPGAASANAALLVACDIAAPNVSGQITAVASFSPSLSVDLDAQLDLAADCSANISAAIAAVPPIPVVALDAQVAMALSVKADLEAMLATIQAKLALQVQIAGLLAAGSIEGYAWDGRKEDLGAAVTAALGSDATHSNAILLLTTNGASWTAMQGMFKTS